MGKLPAVFFKRIARLAKKTGKTPERVLREAIEQYGDDPSQWPADKLKAAAREYHRQLAVIASSNMTPAQRSARASNAARAMHRKRREKQGLQVVVKEASGAKD